jgi:preprotein translocase subunit Sec63
LSKKDKYDNWKKYGHPEGALTIKAVELMLPSLLMDKSMITTWLTLLFLVSIACVLGFMTW